VLGVGAPHTREREDELKAQFPEVNYIALSELFGGPLLTEFSRSLTRLKVQQYQRFFSDADRVLILMHNDPDPDAMASGLALRTVLKRTKQTAVLGAIHGVTRPENQRMVNLLDIQIGDHHARRTWPTSTAWRWWTCRPHYFSGAIDRVGPGHRPPPRADRATRRSTRTSAPTTGSTSTILTEHLRAGGQRTSRSASPRRCSTRSSRTRLFFNRQANRVDIEAFSYLYPLADAGDDPEDRKAPTSRLERSTT
jgi:hypothetical protein